MKQKTLLKKRFLLISVFIVLLISIFFFKKQNFSIQIVPIAQFPYITVVSYKNRISLNSITISQLKGLNKSPEVLCEGKPTSFVRYKEFLICEQTKYNEQFKQFDSIGIVIINLSTGKKQLVYQYQNQETPQVFSGSDIFYVQNDILFFSVSNALHAIHLKNLTLKPAILYNTSPNKESLLYKLENNLFFLVGGQVDCGGEWEYFSIDPITLTVSSVFHAKSHCFEGKNIFGVDQENNLIVSSHISNNQNKFNNPDHYLDIEMIPIKKPDTAITILDTTHKPTNVRDIYLVPNTNELLLLGDTLSIVNLKTKKLRQTVSLPIGAFSDCDKTPYKDGYIFTCWYPTVISYNVNITNNTITKKVNNGSDKTNLEAARKKNIRLFTQKLSLNPFRYIISFGR